MTNSDKGNLFLRHFIDEAERTLISALETKKDIFPSRSTLVNRYRAAANHVLQEGFSNLRAFHEMHNEVCTAAVLLEESSVKRVDYEPQINNCKKRFDFHITMTDGSVSIIEVKTIHPISKDDWTKYKVAIEKGLFPENAYLLLNDEWLGGELYHNSYAARSKMLDYTLEMEEKIESCLKDVKEKITILVFFTDGFDWHLDELEDFVSFYRSGRHLHGDPFAAMEDEFIKKEGVHLKNVIRYFACLRRPKTEIRPTRIIWNVSSPSEP